MKLSIVSIGNSQGIRIPKSILKQCNITKEVNIEIDKNNIVLKPILANVRHNWDMKFKAMHENKEDNLYINDNLDMEFSLGEWE